MHNLRLRPEMACRLHNGAKVTSSMKLGQNRAEQERELKSLRQKWLKAIVSTKPANRKEAEDGVRATYRAAGAREPDFFLWFDGLLEAAIAAEQLGWRSEGNWLLPPKALRHRNRIRQDLRHTLGVRAWPQVVKAVGVENTPVRIEERAVPNPLPIGRRTLHITVAVKREDGLQAGLAPFDPFALDGGPDSPALKDLRNELDSAGRTLLEQQRRLFGCHMGPGGPGHSSLDILSPLHARDYPFGFLAVHEFLFKFHRKRISGAYQGLWKVAHNCGAWWSFSNAAVMADRPRQLHFDDDGKLHNPDGAAVIYRSGLALYAIHGSYQPSPSGMARA